MIPDALGLAADGVLLGIQGVFILCCWIYLVAGLDDLLVDVMWAGYQLADRLTGTVQHPPSPALLRGAPERPMAIMFPAWHEADVIGSAVANILATLEYRNFQVFIGTYPNDAETQHEVDKLVLRFGNVHKVVTAAPGPTCKADCLNHILASIRAFEGRTGTEFIGVIMQDAEDVVPPLALHLFNHYARRFDLVQIPVLSLRRRWWDLTGGHYMEEFAEFHAKEMFVRERFAGVVPGCGVGTFYSRRALSLAEATGETFSTRSLTEDYEFSFRMRDAGLRMHFVRMFLREDRLVQGWRRPFGGLLARRTLIATREYFPNGFRASFRQKSRWTVGISLQGWRNFGWRAGWRVRYLFWRDRRSLVLSHVTVLGVVALLAFAGLQLFELAFPEEGRLAPLLPDGDWMWNVVWINLGLLAHRLAQRHFWALVHYGPGVLPMVTPRYVWAAVINYCALIRALRLWARHLRTGAAIGWDKTAHQFPIGATATPAVPQGLGDLLLDRKLVEAPVLMQARTEAEAQRRPLSRVLVESGALGEDVLARVLSECSGAPPCPALPDGVPAEVLAAIPPDLARAMRCVPVALARSGHLVVAASILLEAAEIAALEAATRRRLEITIATESFVDEMLRRMEALQASGPFPGARRDGLPDRATPSLAVTHTGP